jgi:hypothetical protein
VKTWQGIVIGLVGGVVYAGILFALAGAFVAWQN